MRGSEDELADDNLPMNKEHIAMAVRLLRRFNEKSKKCISLRQDPPGSKMGIGLRADVSPIEYLFKRFQLSPKMRQTLPRKPDPRFRPFCNAIASRI